MIIGRTNIPRLTAPTVALSVTIPAGSAAATVAASLSPAASVVPIVPAPVKVDINVPSFPSNVPIPSQQIQGLTRATLPEADTGMPGIMNTQINLDVYKIMTVDHLRRFVTKFTPNQSIVNVKQMWLEHTSPRTTRAENALAQIIISKG